MLVIGAGGTGRRGNRKRRRNEKDIYTGNGRFIHSINHVLQSVYIFRYTPALFGGLLWYISDHWPSGNITNKFLTARVYLTYPPLDHGLYITYISKWLPSLVGEPDVHLMFTFLTRWMLSNVGNCKQESGLHEKHVHKLQCVQRSVSKQFHNWVGLPNNTIMRYVQNKHGH